jgi:hypothetical protein
MGFIDYHGTKEDRYTEVLEYARAQQEEDWKRKDEQKLTLWLRDLTGSSTYAQLNVEDLVKYVVVKYRIMKQAWQSLMSLMKTDSGINSEQLWNDFSTDIAARHLSSFHLSQDKKTRYLQTFQTKVFKLSEAISAEDYYRIIAENPKYRQYFAECFDPTWKGQQVFKWLYARVKKNKDGMALLNDFLDADRDCSLFLSLYLHQVILPHDDGWMREAEAERKAILDIRGKIHRGTIFGPDMTVLGYPLHQARTESTSTAPVNDLVEDGEHETIQGKNQESSLPDSGLNKQKFRSLLQGGKIPEFVEASKMLLECELPDDIAQTYRQLVDRMPILQDAIRRFDDIYHADMDQFEEYFAPEALRITAVYLDYQAVRPSEKILKETRDGVFLATRKLLQVVNEKIDEIYRFVTIDANAEAKALETIMSQDGHVDPAYRIK